MNPDDVKVSASVPAMRVCLACLKKFKSESAANRICPTCRAAQPNCRLPVVSCVRLNGLELLKKGDQ